MIDYLRTVVSRFTQAPLYSARPQALPFQPAADLATPADLYRVLRAFYLNNALYDRLGELLRQYGVWRETLKGLRNPAFRVVEWHAGHMFPGALPGALPIETTNAAIIPAIQQMWSWSNWASKKQVFARYLALYGHGFLKVVQSEDKSSVYFQVIEPEFVTAFDADPRGFLTFLRIDTPRTRRNEDGRTEPYTHTEVWSKAQERMRIWEHGLGSGTELEELGKVLKEVPLSEFGIDFIPAVSAPFIDIGEDRGVGAFTLQLDKIDEANRMATRLHQMLFRHNNVTSALERQGMDTAGRPLPPASLGGEQDTLRLGDDVFLSLPANTTLKQLVPQLAYADALAILNAQLHELSQDLPELIAYELGDQAQRNLSGRAVRLLLGAAVARAAEARGNAEAALIRADQMALSIARHAGLFPDLGGSYDDGSFDHSFAPRDFLPQDELEDAQVDQTKAQSGLLRIQLGVSEAQVQRELGYSDEDIQRMAGEKQAGDQQLGAALLKNFDANKPNGKVSA